MAAKLSVVVPVYNEAATLDEIVRRVQAVDVTKEILIVDDGSSDGSFEISRKLEEEFENVRTWRHDRNRGKGRALRTAFAHATGEFVVIQDADLEYDPADFSTLLAPLAEGRADVVYGSRFLSDHEHRELNIRQYLANRWLTLLSNATTHFELTDVLSCYKVFRRDFLQSIVLEEDGFSFEPEVTSKIAKAGLRVCEVGISYRARSYASGKKIRARDGLWAVWCVFKYACKPLERR